MGKKDELRREEENFYQTASTEECVRNLRRKFFRYRLVLAAELALIIALVANWVLHLHWAVPVVAALALLALLGVAFLNGCRMVLYQLPEGILYHDCDAVKYSTLLRTLSANAGKKQKLVLDIQLCSALYASGGFTQAREVLDSIEPKIRSGMATFVIDLRAKLDAAEDDYSRFPEYIERLKKMYAQYKSNDKALAQIIGTLDSVEFYRDLHDGNLDKCRKTLDIWGGVCANEYQRVYVKYLMGVVQQSLDPKLAKECFQYVVDHGNTMYQKAIAAKRLKEI